MAFLFHYNLLLNIKAKTIHMQKPFVSDDGVVKRRSAIQSKLNESLILKEAISRRSAYKNTSIKTGEPFFNDSDMASDYHLIVIYDRKYNIPLLTARYYYDQTAIARSLKGDAVESTLHSIDLTSIDNGGIFLSDRLSGNVNSSIYRRHRNYIFLLFYLEILARHHNGQFILMARKEKHDKLLKKYLHIGLKVIGSNMHKGREHWVLLGDVRSCEAQLKLSFILKTFLIIKKITNKFN